MRFGMNVLYRLALVGIVLLSLRPASVTTAPQSISTHDRTFWRNIADNRYAVPEGESAFALARELSGYLGSTDPELRDDLAYSILDAWVVRRPRLPMQELLAFLDEWTANLEVPLGESGTDSVLKRSFSALCLASLADRELKTQFLGPARYHSLLYDAISYLSNERDLRGRARQRFKSEIRDEL